MAPIRLLPPRRLLDWVVVSVLAATVIGGAIAGVWLSRYAVAVHRLTRGIGDTVFYGADGQPWFRLDGQRHDVALGDIALDLQHAVVAVEDRRFYHHPGIDPIGVARAVVNDVRPGRRLEGGSTLTQQLARTLFLSNVKTYGRKIGSRHCGAHRSAVVEEPDLEFYLNRVYLSAGVRRRDDVGHLFRKPASGVTCQAAFIAGLIQAPSALSPWSNYDGALAHLVLAQMRDQHFITPEQEEAAHRCVRASCRIANQPSSRRLG